MHTDKVFGSWKGDVNSKNESEDEEGTILRVSISPMARVSNLGLATAIGACFGSGSFDLDLNLFQKPA